MSRCPECGMKECCGGDMAAEITRMESALSKQKPSCEWREDADGDWWTACGQGFCLEVGTPVANEMKFCCYCGGDLVEVAFVYPDDGEEEE